MEHDPLPIVDAGDRGGFMEVPADPVSKEVVDDAKALTPSAPLHRPSDLSHAHAWAGRVHGLCLSHLGRSEKPVGDGRNLAHRQADPGVGEISLEFCGYVEVDEVTFSEVAGEGRDTMSGLVVDADTGGTREAIGDPWGRVGAMATEDVPPNGIEFTCRDTGHDGGRHLLASLPYHLRSVQQAIEVILRLYGHCEGSYRFHPGRNAALAPAVKRLPLSIDENAFLGGTGAETDEIDAPSDAVPTTAHRWCHRCRQ
jgi:hypothetical protein